MTLGVDPDAIALWPRVERLVRLEHVECNPAALQRLRQRQTTQTGADDAHMDSAHGFS